MKKIVFLALFAFSLNAQSQEINIQDLVDNNPVLRTAYYSTTLSLNDKITVINEQVQEGVITKDQAFSIINEIANTNETQNSSTVSTSWTDALNPFKEAMEVQIDTVPKYRTQVSPYFSYGVGNVAVDGAFANSEFGYMRSNSIEWGIAVRRPFSENSNTWGIRYGLGFKYQGLATTQNNEFAVVGDQTITVPSTKALRNNYAYLRNTYVTIPVTLDFTTTKKVYNDANKSFVTKSGFNFGVGGFVGYNLNSKQFVKYTNEMGSKVSEEQKHDWNVTNFQYGLMAYAGSDRFKVVAKYDLNPLFENNTINQQYWTLGIQIGL